MQGTSEVAIFSQEFSSSNINANKPMFTDGCPEKGIPYECTYPGCTYKTMHFYKMKKHSKTHENMQSYDCSYCSFSTFDRNQWRLHMLKDHHEQLPFKCHICECKFLFERNYLRHFRVHKGERALPCPVCERKYCTKAIVRETEGGEWQGYKGCEEKTLKILNSVLS